MLQNFAPDTIRVSLSKMANNLPGLCRHAKSNSVIYLPKLIDEYKLDRDSAVSWLKLLSDIVNAMGR